MPDLCKECRHFYIEHKKLEGYGMNISKTGNRPSDYYPEDKCKLGHIIVKSIDGLVPRTYDYTCDDFIEK